MNELRRSMLRGASAAVIAPLLGTGLLLPTRTLASDWNPVAFSARNVQEALKAYGAASLSESRDIIMIAPEIAENGAKVEVEITSNLPNTRSLAIFVDRNPMPLCASLSFSGYALPFARVQLKMAETTRVRAVIKTADGKHHVAFREVKVTLGGCGG